MKKATLADLKVFLGTVFHPDWTIQHESADHAIKKWMRKADDKQKKAVLHDINSLLGQESDETLENWICEEAKGDIFPPALGFTYSTWLRHVGEMIAGPQRKSAKKKAE